MDFAVGIVFLQTILAQAVIFVTPFLELIWVIISLIRYSKRNREDEMDCHRRKNQLIISGSVLAINIAYILFSIIASKIM